MPRREDYENPQYYTDAETLIRYAVDGIRSHISDVPAEGIVVRPHTKTETVVDGAEKPKRPSKLSPTATCSNTTGKET